MRTVQASMERREGLIYSVLIHLIFLALIVIELPSFFSPPPPEPQSISVEILPISEISNVKPSPTPPAPEQKEEKPAPEKPQPHVKTVDDTPPPPPLPLSDMAEKKLEKKPPPPKKEEKKKEIKQDDLAAVLKAVEKTAQQQKKTEAKQENDTANASKSDQYNASMPMSMSEKDAIRSQFAHCWSPPIGAKDAYKLSIVLHIEVDHDGSVLKVELANESKSRYSSDDFFRAAAESAIRAVRQCSPLQNLPPEKYQTWHDMELTFDPKEMLF